MKSIDWGLLKSIDWSLLKSIVIDVERALLVVIGHIHQGSHGILNDPINIVLWDNWNSHLLMLRGLDIGLDHGVGEEHLGVVLAHVEVVLDVHCLLLVVAWVVSFFFLLLAGFFLLIVGHVFLCFVQMVLVGVWGGVFLGFQVICRQIWGAVWAFVWGFRRINGFAFDRRGRHWDPFVVELF